MVISIMRIFNINLLNHKEKSFLDVLQKNLGKKMALFPDLPLSKKLVKKIYSPRSWQNLSIELLNNNSHGLSSPGGLVSPSGGFVSLLCDQGLHFASILLCQASCSD